MRSHTTIETAKASGYLQQLCKHFGHKVPAECTPTEGKVTFEMGTATLAANDTRLEMSVEGADGAAVERLEGVLASHLERFAFREELRITWTRAA